MKTVSTFTVNNNKVAGNPAENGGKIDELFAYYNTTG
jgi:hypothetical protein